MRRLDNGMCGFILVREFHMSFIAIFFYGTTEDA